MANRRERSFQGQGKEPVIERIAELVNRYTSRSAAARAWGINVNTLNSYFKNVPVPPTPRENLLRRIAEKEQVSLGWLQGNNEALEKTPKLPINDGLDDSPDGLVEMLMFLTKEERQQLASILARKGIDTMVSLIFEFSSLSPSELQRLIRLAKQIREGASEECRENELTNPAQPRRNCACRP